MKKIVCKIFGHRKLFWGRGNICFCNRCETLLEYSDEQTKRSFLEYRKYIKKHGDLSHL